MNEYDDYEPADRLELPPAPPGQRGGAQEREAQQPRPTLSPELTVESSEEEESDDDEEIEELVTDGDRLVPIGDKQPKKKKPNPTKELFDGLRKVEQELRDKKDKEDADDNVSWNELHSSMLKRYKDKYPNHGPRFNELLRKNNINPDDLKSQSGKKGE
ncbi:hypothetical protein GQ600_3497 [Phytophthora cactorum]|nr:hypothetical protein GQ600_3497 [Phytophthora cactorum]